MNKLDRRQTSVSLVNDRFLRRRRDATSSASANNSESYTVDGRNRLIQFLLGNISTGTISSPTLSQSWALDAVGNWASGTAVSRVNNSKNEIASVGGSSMAYDSVGNLTQDDAGYQYVYDAWGRLVKWVVPGGSTTDPHGYVSYGYTAGSRMASVENFSGAGNVDSYYDLSWRVVESGGTTTTYVCGGGEYTSEQASSQYVWGPTYVNDLVERDNYGDGAGSANYGTATSGLNQRLYAVRDANHDVIAVTNTSGAVVERLDYTPYGTQTVMNASYGAVTDAYDWNVGFQGGVYLQTPATSTPGTQLIQFDNRVYDTALGRWLQPDPAGYVDGANEYLAFGLNPIVSMDPCGLSHHFDLPAEKDRTPYKLTGGAAIKVGDQNIDISVFKAKTPGTETGGGRPEQLSMFVTAHSSAGGCKKCHWIQFVKTTIYDSKGTEVKGQYKTSGTSYDVEGEWEVDATKPDGTPDSAYYDWNDNEWANQDDDNSDFVDGPQDRGIMEENNWSHVVTEFYDLLLCDGKPVYQVSWTHDETLSKTGDYKEEYVKVDGTPQVSLPDYAKKTRLPFLALFLDPTVQNAKPEPELKDGIETPIKM